jgi:hypothetical protein
MMLKRSMEQAGKFAYRFIHGKRKGYLYESRSQTQGGKKPAGCKGS